MAADDAPRRTAAVSWATALPGAELTFPFGEETAVVKASGKMFALVRLVGDPAILSVKAEPDRVTELVRDHDGIGPGYHLSKRHWVSAHLDGRVPEALLRELVEDSYDLVAAGLSARARFELDPDRFPLPGRHRPGAGA